MPIGKFYRICISIILVLLILYLLSKLEFLLQPLMAAFNVLLLPFVLSFFFYYLFRPIVALLHRWHLSKPLAILFLFVLIGSFMTLFLVLVWPTLQEQTMEFINNLPSLANSVQQQINLLAERKFVGTMIQNIDISSKVSGYLEQFVNTATAYLSNAVSWITSFIVVISTVPVLLYYLLKEDKKGYTSLVRILPKKYREDAITVVHDTDKMLSEFVLGRVVCCLLLGTLVYIGFIIIDLPYSLLLAVIVAILNMIPYIGSIIGAIPCILIAFTDSFVSAIWVLVIILIAQQIEGNLISPHVYGRTLNIHPLTTVLVVLVAGSVTGIIGVMISIPVYMAVKIIVLKIVERYEAASG
ncbi:AI-2E family transporter [Paenibacillus beijingensis]|uniref:AI-2E family transporter n=1 Tax=Paenibacillus beijingensis TaxID=1126833 RepID=UPI0006976604|nr:AI-2E family transporter [Paenibacillus beijingensis]